MTGLNLTISRRAALLGAGGVAAFATAAPVLAAAGNAGTGQAAARLPFARYSIGGFEVTTLLDGTASSAEPQKTFGMNVPADEFAEVSAASFLPTDSFTNFFTPTLVNTGKELVLFDTGLGEGARPDRGNMRAALESAGYSPDEVNVVVLTHMHPDHIGGVMEGGKPAFANARYVTGAKEYDFWSKMDPAANGAAKLVAQNIVPLADKMTFVEDGGSVVSGITAMAAGGHTPGHMIYMIESDGKQLVLTADTANHYVWSLAHPDWEVRFDMDKEAAAATRRKVLGMLSSDKIAFAGYHMPFPAVGYVEAAGDAFRYVPETYQLRM
ncbi:MBL fold metallo-hydrolase [Roseibium litorale]|uniref:MBL fold metallo-hydrolase n=1 Tax=Roseibium litorale TaxID=2803841 RepID=A0ABR9CTY2_9HYPH|nr:MBL fold metallo-hydrolase [Roseibium litorale]MBD8893757.1 MBL fold metallo-hydrolase [Roseibium litorale]